MTMPDPWTLASAPTVDLLGWTLLHVVWQGALLAAVLAGALRLLRTHSPRVRYVVSGVALVGLLVLPVGTSLFLGGQAPIGENSASPTVVVAPSAMPGSPREAVPGAAATAASAWTERAAAWLRPALPWLVLGWGVGVTILAARLAGGAWRVRRLRRSSRPAPAEWRERLQDLAGQMGLSGSVALQRSARVEGPVVAGWWRPVVLVPAGFLSGLPPDQVEALLLHELAHVRRHDVLVGRLQAVVETLLFFHPATWWISRQVRQTREACCDDLAVRAGTDRTVYARALTALAERAVGGATAAWAPAASDGSLLGRIRRLLSPVPTPSTRAQRLSMAVAVLLLVGVPLGLAACASQESATGDEGAGEASAVMETQVVVRGDSSRAWGGSETGSPIPVKRLDDGRYALWTDGRRDTLALPFDPDSLARAVTASFDADSIARVVQFRIDPDSIRRAVEMSIDLDSLEERVRVHYNPDSLEQQAQRMQLHAHRLARGHREHADSLRRHLDSLRERWEQSDRVPPGVRMQREMPERLREQARRLREQAERLEERAREMEVPEPPHAPTPPSSDSANASRGPEEGGRLDGDDR
jgi:beta-lactamase regulating signal transducer with metallopeptidase domain